MELDCQDRILLTGAGFTKNFGGPLAKELWSLIFSNPTLDEAPEVREILRRDFDFESAYNEFMQRSGWPIDGMNEGPAWVSQMQALRRAVSDAYLYIDKKVQAFSNRPDALDAVNIYKVQEFIARFAGDTKKPGFFFTLNQDLFVERQYYNGPRPTLLGIPQRATWFTANCTQSLLSEERCVIPPSANDLEVGSAPFYYLKLHGSSNWYTADQETMVIGHAKEGQIAAQPILAKYFDIFKTVLAGEHRRLLCVGYSFSDNHINAAILAGVKAGLRLYVLSPESPDVLAARLGSQGEAGKIMWRGLAGYFQADFKTLFPADQTLTAEWKLIDDRFF